MTKFSDFAFGEPILTALAAQGYSNPTPIQTQAVRPILAGRDICGIARTGTGKTAAFALPILQRLVDDRRPIVARAPRVLVLTPTRELASQVAQSFRTYGNGLRLSTAVVFGGVGQRPQVEALRRGVDILVATPGRLLDLVEQRLLTLGGVEILVVDEADQMLDLGFIVPLRRIVKLVPAKRQTLFFSATMPKTIAQLADSLLANPVQVAVAPVATTVERVAQSVTFVSTAQKQPLLEHLLSAPEMERVLVFTRTKHGADKVVRGLAKAGVEAAAIHGNKSQAQRERALAAFKSGRTRVLVATDIAARGIHVDAVSHVVNFDLPNVPESYVHRIGRTARAGAPGIATSFCNGEERAYLRDIEKLTRQNIAVAPLPAGFTAEPKSAASQTAHPDSRVRGRHKQASGPRRQARASARRGNEGKERNGGGGRRERSSGSGGLDPATGLPAFLSRPGRREHRADDRA